MFIKYHSGIIITTIVMMTPQISLLLVPETNTMTLNTATYTSAVPTSGWSTTRTIGMPM